MRMYLRNLTNSFAGKNAAAYYPYYVSQQGTSFYGLSRPQYSHQTYYQLAANGAGAGNRGGRWANANGVQISFVGI
jgi:hypothetical protein